MKFCTVVLHTVLLSNCEFHENRCSESHSLLNGVIYIFFFRLFFTFILQFEQSSVQKMTRVYHITTRCTNVLAAKAILN